MLAEDETIKVTKNHNCNSFTMLKALLLRLLILLGLFQVASSEIRPFNSLLDPSVGVQKKKSFRMNKTTFILLQYLGLLFDTVKIYHLSGRIPYNAWIH